MFRQQSKTLHTKGHHRLVAGLSVSTLEWSEAVDDHKHLKFKLFKHRANFSKSYWKLLLKILLKVLLKTSDRIEQTVTESITPACVMLCAILEHCKRFARKPRGSPIQRTMFDWETQPRKTIAEYPRAIKWALELVGVWRATSPPRCVHNVYAEGGSGFCVRESVDYRLAFQ